MKTLKKTPAGLLVLLTEDEIATARLIFDEEKSTRVIPAKPRKSPNATGDGSRYDGPHGTRPPFIRIKEGEELRTVTVRRAAMQIPVDYLTMEEAGARVDRSATAVLRQFPDLKVKRVHYATGNDGVRVVHRDELEKYARRMGWDFKKR